MNKGRANGPRGGDWWREYQMTSTIGGVPQKNYGTACLQADGTWRIVN
jgi:surface antigen